MTTDAALLTSFFSANQSLAVLTGAGVSTASGIPDYRDRNGDWKTAQPIQYNDFVRSSDCRKRYWARSFAGWQRFSSARPNGAHHAIFELETAGIVDTLVTQNVDGLHTDAGSRRVIELHGDLRKVRCLTCNATNSRPEFQQRLHALNPDCTGHVVSYKPDGDVDLPVNEHHELNVPPCLQCGGVVKPDVVMFGENVPAERVRSVMDAVERSDALLVIGSSLTVFSGFRFARRAGELQKPIAIVNRGKTRADKFATLKIDDDCVKVLSAATLSVHS